MGGKEAVGVRNHCVTISVWFSTPIHDRSQEQGMEALFGWLEDVLMVDDWEVEEEGE